ncbi:unnamed protein product [Ilex paraguariensis]|uniref:Uncharacterized protein n=1 Tax=Ilex paraguariensis TaxID=185542 RepID=A0ABC8UT16_9AQUA
MNRLVIPESLSNSTKLEAAMREIEELKSKSGWGQEKGENAEERGLSRDLGEVQKTKPKVSEVRNGILMKDIPLDHVSDGSVHGISRRGNVGADEQMLGLWETAEEDCSQDPAGKKSQKQAFEPTDDDILYHQLQDIEQRSEHPSSELQVEKELGVDQMKVFAGVTEANRGKNRKILERLASDAQKLASLQLTVQDLTRTLETKKKSKKSKDVDFETVKEQLQEVEESVVQLVDFNGQLMKKIEECPSSSDGKDSAESVEAVNVQRKKVSEQARKGSEKIGRLQLEIQKIQYLLLKMEDGKKHKGRSRFSRSRTTIILRDFVYSSRRRSSAPQKKSPLCGCFKPSTNGDRNHI